MKVLIKHKKSTLLSVIILMVLTICITIGKMGDETSKYGYTVYQSKSAVTHIDSMDINISTPKDYVRFFSDSSNEDVSEEMQRAKIDFVSIAHDYSIMSEYFILKDFSNLDNDTIDQRIKKSQEVDSYEITDGITHETVTIGNQKVHKASYIRREMAYLYYDVVVEYFLEHDGKYLEIRNVSSEYEDFPDIIEEGNYVSSQVEPYLAEYSYGATVKPQKDNFIWAHWRKFDFAPWVLLLPFIYALLCGMTFTGISEKIYESKTKRYRFVGDEGTGWNEDFLSLNTSKMILGFFSVLIVFHHIVQTTGVDNAGMLAILENYGVCFVGTFFFFSGFGLYESFKNKKDYLKGFLKKRLPSVLIPFYITNIVFFVYGLSTNIQNDTKSMVLGLLGVKLLNSHTWYIVEIVFLYVIFLIIFRFIKNQKVSIFLLYVAVISMMITSLFLGHGEKWFQGEWWYNTTLLFPIGVLFSYNKENIVYFMKRFYRFLLPVTIILFCVLNKSTNYMLTHYSYWSETSFDKGYDDKALCLIVQCPMVIVFVLLILMLGLKLKIGNKVLLFLGSISLELYLIHNIFISSLSIIKGTGAYYCSVVFASILAAVVFHSIHNIILCRIYGKKYNGFKNFKDGIREYIKNQKSEIRDFKVRASRSIAYGRKNKRTVRKLMFRNAVCIILCVMSVIPVLILIINATQTRTGLMNGISFVPGGYFAENLRGVKADLESGGLNLYRVIGLSCAISLTCTFLGTYVGAMCAFGFEYYSFRGKRILWKFIVFTLMVPAVAGSVGFLKLVSMLNLYDNLIPIIMVGITIPSCVYFIRMYLRTFDLTEILEAARIDGCSEVKTFNKIVLPILKPALLLQLTINFANSWNNTLHQNLVLIDTKKKSISVFLSNMTFFQGSGADPVVYCFLLVATIPSLVIFILFSHGITERINLGAVKE